MCLDPVGIINQFVKLCVKKLDYLSSDVVAEFNLWNEAQKKQVGEKKVCIHLV